MKGAAVSQSLSPIKHGTTLRVYEPRNIGGAQEEGSAAFLEGKVLPAIAYVSAIGDAGEMKTLTRQQLRNRFDAFALLQNLDNAETKARNEVTLSLVLIFMHQISFAMCTAVSAMRLEKPHSLSYQVRIEQSLPSITLV